MVTKTDFESLLLARFSNVPEITLVEAAAITAEMLTIFELGDTIPTMDATKYLAFASSEMAMKIALNTAHYFKFTDGEESVDKTMVSEAYRKIAKEYRMQFDETHNTEIRRSKATFKNVHRIDRPPFER